MLSKQVESEREREREREREKSFRSLTVQDPSSGWQAARIVGGLWVCTTNQLDPLFRHKVPKQVSEFSLS